MVSTNDLGRPQDLSPSEVTRIFGGMSPLQATRYYNKCMTNPNTPDANLSLLRQFRSQNPNRFLSDEQMKATRRKGQNDNQFRRSQGSWVAERGFSGGYRNRSNGRVYSDGYSYDAYGNSYDPSGNPVGGWQDGGRQISFKPRQDTYAKGNGLFRKKKPISEARSIDELGAILKGFGNPIRGRLFLEKIVNNSESNPQTVENAKYFLNSNSALVANDEQFAAYMMLGPKKSGAQRNQRRRFFNFQRKPVDQARSPNEIANTVTHLRDNISRTRYFDKVVNNPNSNIETVDNLIAFKDQHPELFASAEEVANAPHRDSLRSRFWKPQEEFDQMSPAKKKFFVGAVNRNNRAKNTAFSLRVITDPETNTSDRKAMVEVVRENPLLFFKNPRPLRRQLPE